MTEDAFWRTVPLEAMTDAQWESLCDGCGRCCLHKLRDEDSGVLAFTNVACRLLDQQTCRCRDYAGRQQEVTDCMSLREQNLAEIDWLPPSCAYRLVAEGRDLPDWHALRSGDPDGVHRSGASVRGRVVSETVSGPFEDHVVMWPGRSPRRRASKS